MARPVTPLLTVVALAVLAETPLHGYVLKKRVDLALGTMLAISDGSLYPLLRSLEERGAISSHVESAEHGRPDRVVYAITDSGREELASRLGEPLATGHLASVDFYVRVACFGHLVPEARIALVGERRTWLVQGLDALRAARDAVAHMPGHLELADLRERQLRAELAWLNDLEETLADPTKEDYS